MNIYIDLYIHICKYCRKRCNTLISFAALASKALPILLRLIAFSSLYAPAKSQAFLSVDTILRSHKGDDNGWYCDALRTWDTLGGMRCACV